MSEGLVLQDAAVWRESLGIDLIPRNNMTELYFEESDLEGFVRKLEESEFEIEYVSKPAVPSTESKTSGGCQQCLNTDLGENGGRKTVRFYDPDGNLIEVGTPNL